MLPLLARVFGGKPERGDRGPRRQRLRAEQWPSVLYAIGDIHGCLEELKALESLIVEDARGFEGEKWIVTLGDYIDRGPDSFGTVSRLMAPPPEGFRRISLAGNHEQLLVNALDNPQTIEEWFRFGGAQTGESYGLAPAQLLSKRPKLVAEALTIAIPPSHLDWLRNRPISLLLPGMLFVHAGIKPGVSLDEQRDEDLIWIRAPFLDGEADPALTVVHGHTPAPAPVIAPGRIGIDTGAYATGVLTAARFVPGEAPRFLSTARS